MASKNGTRLLHSEEITLSELATLVHLSERQVHRLTNQGVFVIARTERGRSKYVLGEAIPAFMGYLREALTRDSNDEVYNAARARRMAAVATAAELALQLQRGKLHHASDVEFVMTNMLTFFKQRVLAIPSRISRQLIGKAKFQEIYDLIMGEIVGCLWELSGYNPSMFAEQTAAQLAEKGADLAALEHEP